MDIIKKSKIVFNKIISNKIGEYTASCSYYTILAFIPFVMFTLTLIKYIGLEQDKILEILNEIFSGNVLKTTIIEIIKEVYSKSVGTITISALFTLWSAGKGFYALCKGLSTAYEVSDEKSTVVHFRIRGLICTIIFILLTVLTLALLVFGNSINMLIRDKFSILNTILEIILKAKVFISIILLSLFFTLMYRFIPKHKYKMKNQIPGAILAAVLCNLISIFYAIYVDLFKGFSIMYGSLTTIVLAMMWVYACMYSILIGAIVNKVILEEKTIE